MNRRIGFLVTVVVLVSCSDEPSAPVRTLPAAPLLNAGAAAQVAAGDYIVVFRPAVPDARLAADDLLRQHGGRALHYYGTALKGFAANLSPAALDAIRRHPLVEFVEADGVMSIDGTQTPATWGLDRVDQRSLPLDNSYTYNVDGASVVAYIIDTGLRTSHDEFGGRASGGFDAIDGLPADDCHGHGTHVGGTVGGTTYGIAKSVTLIAVRVLNCQGSGSTSQVIAGIDYVTAHHTTGPAVANMSLGGGASTALDNAVRNSIADGVTYSIAAGNSSTSACNVSPARTVEAITVGATTWSDARASYSNFGTCLDLFAPGSAITSAWSTSNTAANTISGTSMAAPHVAGAAALYLQTNPGSSPSTVRDAIVNAATANVVTNPGSGSPNRLLYTLFGSAPPPPPPSSGIVAHVEDLSASALSLSSSRWRAIVTIAVRDADGNAVSGATVTGQWTSGVSGSTSCATGSNGSCSVTRNSIKRNVASVTWAVSGISGTNVTYDVAANTESSIVVNRP
ncbi:MAG TPA: S8 family serine peptidase [Gemmatimonadaceae bacterium]